MAEAVSMLHNAGSWHESALRLIRIPVSEPLAPLRQVRFAFRCARPTTVALEISNVPGVGEPKHTPALQARGPRPLQSPLQLRSACRVGYAHVHVRWPEEPLRRSVGRHTSNASASGDRCKTRSSSVLWQNT